VTGGGQGADYWRALITELARDLARTRAGESTRPAATNEWFQLARRLRVIAESIVRRPTLAGLDPDDLAQDALTRLQDARILDRVQRARTPIGYLYRMMLNRAIDVVRQQRREAGLRDRFDADLRSALYPETDEDAEEAASGRVARLRRALRQLPPNDRLMLRRRFWEGRDTAAIARELNISYAAAAVRLHRLLERLAGDLAET
jgi:RNA polymerase sigma factor (sigma-70 family)